MSTGIKSPQNNFDYKALLKYPNDYNNNNNNNDNNNNTTFIYRRAMSMLYFTNLLALHFR